MLLSEFDPLVYEVVPTGIAELLADTRLAIIRVPRTTYVYTPKRLLEGSGLTDIALMEVATAGKVTEQYAVFEHLIGIAPPHPAMARILPLAFSVRALLRPSAKPPNASSTLLATRAIRRRVNVFFRPVADIRVRCDELTCLVPLP